ncbi:MAG: hypothetical protein K1060chlam4_01382, partial [Candidatus Anoxychlamydiales bacterium]|nr:hypothetical protein [Candidatus Anoxychlamydiales bacterium]
FQVMQEIIILPDVKAPAQMHQCTEVDLIQLVKADEENSDLLREH